MFIEENTGAISFMDYISDIMNRQLNQNKITASKQKMFNTETWKKEFGRISSAWMFIIFFSHLFS
jgi:hypothetical protein